MASDEDFAAIAQSIADEAAPQKSVAVASAHPASLQVFSYAPDLMVDLIVQNPSWDMKQLGQVFGQTAGWVSKVLSTKAFQDALEPRRSEVLNPEFAMTLDERFQALTIRSLSVMQEKLEAGKALPDLTILKAAELGVKALGMGQKLKEEKPQEPQRNSSELVADRIMAAMQKRKAAESAVDVEVREVPDGE
jgi:hypothetical protein